MESEKPYIEILRNCKSREEVIQFFEEESHNEIQYWPDSAYEHAAEMLNEAQGSSECHYTSCDGPVTPQMIFEAQISTLLAGTWKYTLEVQKAQEALKKTEKYDWVDFDEKKPDEKDEYLVSSNGGKRSVDIWLGTFFLGHPSGVDYWMPLPPAKVKEKKDERRR